MRLNKNSASDTMMVLNNKNFPFLSYHDILLEEWNLAIDKVHSQKEFLNFWYYDIRHLNRKQRAKFPRGYLARYERYKNSLGLNK
jgi:hypothetical protein